MFAQVDRSIERVSGGLGIGLALVKGLVESHRGTVTAASDGPGKGSTFTVRLPIARETLLAPVEQAPVARRAEHKRVLVVDDNRDAASLLAELLQLLGHEAMTAHDGLAAVAMAEKERPDLVLMDLGMPGIDGFEATRRIRSQPWSAGIVIVALTGWGHASDRERSAAAGCAGHLVKPASIADIERVLAGLGS